MRKFVKFNFCTALMMMLMFTVAMMQSSAVAVTYYQTNKSDVPIWSQASSKSSKRDVLPYGTVLRVTGSTVNSSNNLWYRLDNGNWVFSGNVTKHSHSYNNGGYCTGRNCGYEWPYTIYSASGTYQVTNTNGAKIWSRPYSNNSTHYRTSGYGSVLSVNARTTNREGNVWYRLTDGSWVFSGNIKQRFSITFNANGGSAAPATQYVLKDTSFTLTSQKPTRNGYVFKGWATSSTATTAKYFGGKSYKLSGNVSFYAVWDQKCSHSKYEGGYCTTCSYQWPYTVSSLSGTFQVTNADGAKIWSRPYSKRSTHLRTAKKGSVVTVVGKTTNKDGNLWYKLNDGNWVFSGNVKQRFTVKYNANGGKTPPSSQNFLSGQTLTLSSKKPARTGYVFKGWSSSASSTKVQYKAGASYAAKKSITLYAVWSKCKHLSCTDGYCSSCKTEVDMTISGMYTKVESVSSNTAALNYLKKNVGTVKKSGTIPGLKKAVTRKGMNGAVTTCDNMVPQGFTFAGDYLLISAYCACGKSHRSVIYVMDSDTRKYLTTLIVDDMCHVGGLAKSGNYLWVCDTGTNDKSEKILRGYDYSHIKAAVATGRSYYTLPSAVECTVAVSPSYMCSANGYLYVGKHYKENTTAKIYYYVFNNSLTDPEMKCKGSFTVDGVSKIQGISIRNNKMVITSSYGRRNYDTSKVYVYSDSSNFTTKNAIYNKPIKKFNFANMVEGCYIGQNNTYFLVESAAKEYRYSLNTRPLDKYVSFDNATIKTNK